MEIRFHYKHAIDGKRMERWAEELSSDGWTMDGPDGIPENFEDTTITLTQDNGER
jgi:hypothetical protein